MTKEQLTTRARLDDLRRGEIARKRFRQGIKELFSNPMKALILIPLLVAALLCWFNIETVMALLSIDISALPYDLTQEVIYLGYGVVVTVFLLLLVGLIPLIGTPRESRRIEKGLKVVFDKAVSYSYWPIYLACSKGKYTFFSAHIPIDVWRDRQAAVALLLRGHIVGDFEYGGKNGNDPRYIVVNIAPGAAPKVDGYDFSKAK